MQEKIRFVELKDSTGILNIYTPYVLDTTISFEYEPPTLAEFTERISNISSKYPYLVYEQNLRFCLRLSLSGTHRLSLRR